MKRIHHYLKRIFAIILVLILAVESLSAAGIKGMKTMIVQAAENKDGYQIDNGYIKVTLSHKNGGFGIRTLEGDKVNKDDNNKYLLFEYDGDNTSFTSFQVTRAGETKEYIFGGKYPGSSAVAVSKEENTLIAVWSVDDLTFTQKIAMADTGSNEHGTAAISYTVKNAGTPAQIKCRILMDTALGYQDYAHYNLGDMSVYTDRETTIDASGYNKVFYAVDDPDYPSMTAYTINSSIENMECKPYQVTFAHWNNLAASVFDYSADDSLTFTNAYNKEYLTADSAYALYYDMGEVAEGKEVIIGTNYGIFSNESVSAKATTAVNVVAPDVLEYAKDANGNEIQNAYENEGIFTVKTYVENFGEKEYEKVRILVYATGGIDPLTQTKEPANSTYDNPYYLEIKDFSAGERQDIDWYFKAVPQEAGQYAKVHYKVYDVSDSATLNTGAIMTENLLGEGYSYILCPGSVDKIPKIKFTGTTPETIYTKGYRNLYLTGENFSLLLDASAYNMVLKRVDGMAVDGKDSFVIPEEQINIDDYKNTMTITMTDDNPGELPEGMYQLTLDFTDEAKEDLTGPGLRFQVKDDVLFKNDTYGYLAVIKDMNSSARGEALYYVEHFASEEDYITEVEAKRINRDDVLLEFRGIFTKSDNNPDDKKVTYEGLSLNDDDNVMVINDCLDVQNGTITITENDGSVTVDFDADIFTTGARTLVWTGVAALTELEAGTEYGLIPYDENGNRIAHDYEVIALMWPSIGSAFQNLMGLLFNFKYGELGVIEHNDNSLSDTRLVAFGAAMDLSFIVPDANPSYSGRTRDYLGDNYDVAEHVKFSPEEVRAMSKRAGGHNVGVANTDAKSWDDREGQSVETGTTMGDDATGGDGDTKSASILIDDILFGGKYLGVNMALAIGLPAYVDGMPALESLVTIRTVGDWSFGVSGVCNFELFYLEGSIKIMSKDGIPVPDTLTFFLGGIEPGINLDFVGVLWLQGAGGGIENLYETIFMTDSLPPLRLILEAQFSLMQVISARATLGLGLRGIDVTLSNGKIANVLPVLNYATIDLDWYPDFYLMGGAQVSILDAISGVGYIVVEESGFFEFFIRALLKIPGAVPVVGGLEIAGVNMGLNFDKVWGQVEVLDIGLGVTYYWAGDIDWNSGSKVYPTYPELAGMGGGSEMMISPIGYSEETGETLYAMVGTNLRASAANMSLRNRAAVQIDETIGDELKTTDLSLATSHTLKLVKNGNGKMLVIEWDAESREQAYMDVIGDDQADLSGISICNTDAAEGEIPFYDIQLLDPSKSVDDEENKGANANLTYNEETKKASLAVTFTKEEAFGPTWSIYTPEGAALVLYDVEPLPELSKPEAADVAVADNGLMTVNVKGNQLDQFTKLSFVAENEAGESVMLYGLEGDIEAQTKNAVAFPLPENLSSGTYKLHMTAWDDDGRFYSSTEAEFTHVNKNQPEAPVIQSVEGAGDYKANVVLDTESSEDFMGYVFDAYDQNGNPVKGVTDMLYYKNGEKVEYDENGMIKPVSGAATENEYVIGGHYEYPYTNPDTEETTTMVAGFSEGDYTISVRKWKPVNGGKSVLYSDAASENIRIQKPVKTEITVTPVLPDGTKSNVVTIVQSKDLSYKQTVYNSNDIGFILASNTQSFTGRWELDGGTMEGTSGKIENLTKGVQISFEDLADGAHTLEFFGKNQYGDATAVKYTFAVDTVGPRLLLSEPNTGSFFDYWTGKLPISGITDKDVKLTITDETTGKVAAVWEEVKSDDFGRFEEEITLDRTVFEHTLTLKAEDALGNASEKQVTVVSDGLGSIEKLMLYAGGQDATNEKLTAGTMHALKLIAKLKRPAEAEESETDLYMELNQEGLVDWQQKVVKGEAEFIETASGMNHKSNTDAEGMITAAFLVNSLGAYTVCASFGDTGEVVKSLENAYVTLEVADALYTGEEVKPLIEVWYQGTLLTEGTDYQVSFENNIAVSNGNTEKPTAVIKGIGSYTGTISETFAIKYLPLEEGWYKISGTVGNDAYYVSDVTVCAEEGYEILSGDLPFEAGNLTIAKEQENNISFRIRRLEDGAVTDLVTETVKVDKTAPSGLISMKEKLWDKFFSLITFGMYQADDYTVTITANDNYSGVENIQYVITDQAYGTVEELEASIPAWKNYSDLFKPVLDGDGTYVVYAKMTDKAGNVSYISSEGMILDDTMPVIETIENGKKYYGDTSFTVTEENLQFVTVDGKEVTSVDGIYTIPADNKKHTIKAVDQNGNTATCIISVYEIYKVSFVVDETVIATVDVNYGDDLAADQFPEIPEKAGYDQTAPVWNPDKLENVTADQSVTAVYTINEYTVTLPTDTEGYKVTTEQNTIVGHGQTFTFTVEVEKGFTATEDYKVLVNGKEIQSSDGVYIINEVEENVHVTVEGIKDITAPKAEITVSNNIWNSFLHTITFGKFFKETQTVKIEAAEEGSGLGQLVYLITDKVMTLDEIKDQDVADWTEYDGTFNMDPNGKYIIYVKAVDKAGNEAYVSSDGMIFKDTAPIVSGIEDGKIYYEEAAFTVTDDYLDAVIVDGKALKPVSGTYTIPADNKEHVIVVTDKAGNSVEYTVSVFEVYEVTFEADGKVVGSITVNYGDDLAADQFPEIPAKAGYDQTAPVWNPDKLENVTADQSVTAVYTINEYTIILPTDTEGYKVTTDQNTIVGHGQTFTFTVEVEKGFTATEDYKVLVNGKEITSINNIYSIDGVDSDLTITVEGIKDITAPFIYGVENGKIYKEELTFTVEDENLDKVLVDGKEAESENGQYKITGDDKEHIIEASDKYGNKVICAVTVLAKVEPPVEPEEPVEPPVEPEEPVEPPVEPEEPIEPEQPENPLKPEKPATGDNSPVLVLLALMLVAAAGIVVILKKKKEEMR